MNIVAGLLVGILLLFLVAPVEADNMTLNNVLPVVVFGSLKITPPVDFLPQKIEAQLKPVNDSGVEGRVDLTEVFENRDTKINLSFYGLKADNQYVSLYYRNSECSLEDGSLDNVVQGAFIADSNGEGKAEDRVRDDISRIRSVGLYSSEDFNLVACASI